MRNLNLRGWFKAVTVHKEMMCLKKRVMRSEAEAGAQDLEARAVKMKNNNN